MRSILARLSAAPSRAHCLVILPPLNALSGSMLPDAVSALVVFRITGAAVVCYGLADLVASRRRCSRCGFSALLLIGGAFIFFAREIFSLCL